MGTIQKRPVDALKETLNLPSVQEQFKNALDKNSALFVASLIDIYSSDQYLQKCAPDKVILEALKAATLKLPINKGLGFAYIVPYGNVPQMQIGWKGYVQLAIRTGQYRKINAGALFEGQNVNTDYLTGDIKIMGEPTSEKTIGYFAYFELLNGFKKAMYWTKEKVHAHAKKFSKAYAKNGSTWQTSPDAMCIKTVLSALLKGYGIMSVEMTTAVSGDNDERTRETQFTDTMQAEANQGEVIDIKTGEITEPVQGKQPEAGPQGPDF